MNWIKLQNMSYNLIYKFGFDIRVVIETKIMSSYNATTDSYTYSTQGYPTKGLLTVLEKKDEKGFITKIENGAMLLPAKGLPDLIPQTDVNLITTDNSFRAVKIKPLQPGNVKLVYKVELV